MRIQKSITMALLAAGILSCSNEHEQPIGGGSSESAEVAYVSFSIYRDPGLRSTENNGNSAETALKSLCLVAFDANGTVTKLPGTNLYYSEQSTTSLTPPAFKISGKAEKLLVIANPGPALRDLMDNKILSTTTFSSFNQAIASIKVSDLIDNAGNTKGFAMISSGDDKAPATDISDPLVDITSFIQKVSTHGSEAAAIAAAEGARAPIRIERLSSKVKFAVKSNVDVKPSGATFDLDNWNLDAVNSTYFPFAYKKLLANTHTGTIYQSSFYTTDPNFTGTAASQGLYYATIGADYAPIAPEEGYATWLADNAYTYCVENTMEADEQKFGNATRVVLRGKYYYDSSVTGDWFNYAGINYASLQDLKDAYSAAPAIGSNLRAACDKMYAHIDDYYTNVLLTSLPAADFLALDESELDAVQNGGEVLKDGKNDIIRWYQKGLCYYYYEIRHNREATAEMEFSKYGVVRNHSYELNLATVNGAGTPWYPDIENPGPGDPDPVDPIDEESAYVGIEITVSPWILWTYDIEV